MTYQRESFPLSFCDTRVCLPFSVNVVQNISSWPVGLGRDAYQQAQYYGPDCSLKRCPGGDDPETDVDETGKVLNAIN